MSLEFHRSAEQASELIAKSLGLASCSPTDRHFELLRASLWGFSGPAGKAHINSLLHAALPIWRILSARRMASLEGLRAELRGALSALDDAGDLVDLGGGYWAPAAARLVALPDNVGHLLVGGIPSSVLSVAPDVLAFHGPHRHLTPLTTDLTALLPHEPFESWARLPGRPLEEWARDLVDSLEREPYSPSIADDFELYLPESSKPGAPQFLRWSQSATNVNGTLLARRRRIYGGREYRLVDLQAGRIVASCELHGIDVRRLMYAFDQFAKNPVRARPLNGDQSVTWSFTSELPRGEQRALAAFGSLTIPQDRPFERRWTFLRSHDVVLGMLRGLGIELGQQGR